jgi:hypothetical protein
MIELDPRRDSMSKMMIAVAAALALGTATMATGTMAFGRGGGGGHFGGGGHLGGGFEGGHFGGGGRFAGGFAKPVQAAKAAPKASAEVTAPRRIALLRLRLRHKALLRLEALECLH